MIASTILIHVRQGRPLSLGKAHLKIWAPVVILTATSTALAGVMSGKGYESLFLGLAAYSSASALLATTVLVGLFFTLHAIKRNLSTLNGEGSECWPKGLERGRTSLVTEDVDAIRDGASWFTSNPPSTRTSVSSWSFSTHQTAVDSLRSYGRPQNSAFGSLPTKSSLGFSSGNKDKLAPQASPIPSLYGTSTLGSDPDPFRRSLPPLPHHPRGRFNSQCSWLTSTEGSHTTVPPWSFPPSRDGVSVRSSTAHSLVTATVPGGNVIDPRSTSHGSLNSLAASQSDGLHVCLRQIIAWAIYVWLPTVCVDCHVRFDMHTDSICFRYFRCHIWSPSPCTVHPIPPYMSFTPSQSPLRLPCWPLTWCSSFPSRSRRAFSIARSVAIKFKPLGSTSALHL